MVFLRTLCFVGAREVVSPWGKGSGEVQCFSKLENPQCNTQQIQWVPSFSNKLLQCLMQSCTPTSPSLAPRPWEAHAAFSTSFHFQLFSFLLSFSLTPGSYFQILWNEDLFFFFLRPWKMFTFPSLLKKNLIFLLKVIFFVNIFL